MTPLRIRGANVIARGEGATEGASDLACKYVDGCFVSRWEPTPRELNELNAGGSVELWCAFAQPAVMLTVAPFGGNDGEDEDDEDKSGGELV